ncbi:hypothetical protein TRFO_23111 [Tritrichomonas foetus]|uniref:Uncharacterized protein n=1 Tax=Tritrichomonas foetus TaxID=1144522 RepID=A0A1J4KAH1_9EUKA|nr:hypothetical protein TRFO_23111 [Tritrichomonas foetus]|eukprot:OHT08423.1 hypothetical protein TRFO_23111 [Tritrichomonas foetus]
MTQFNATAPLSPIQPLSPRSPRTPHSPNAQYSQGNSPRFSKTHNFKSSQQGQIQLTLDTVRQEGSSPYFESIDTFGSYPPPQLPPIRKTNLTQTQPVRPAKVIPPSTPRTPRKYSRAHQEDLPYSMRREWQRKSMNNFFTDMRNKYDSTKDWSKIYSNDFLKMRQHSIERVRSGQKMKEIEDRKQRKRELKVYQESVNEEKNRERFYNDEIYCTTGKQYRFIPNYDRVNSGDEYIFI